MIIDVFYKIVILGLIDFYIYVVYVGLCEEEFYRWFERLIFYLDLLEEGGGIYFIVV